MDAFQLHEKAGAKARGRKRCRKIAQEPKVKRRQHSRADNPLDGGGGHGGQGVSRGEIDGKARSYFHRTSSVPPRVTLAEGLRDLWRTKEPSQSQRGDM